VNEKWKNVSVSHGTLREKDLLPRFVEVLDELKEEATFAPRSDSPLQVEFIDRVETRLGDIERRIEHPEYYKSDSMPWDLRMLFDLLNRFAPEGFYFGTHPGDGSDFGFWEVEKDEE
jgi:hypothetical protein